MKENLDISFNKWDADKMLKLYEGVGLQNNTLWKI